MKTVIILRENKNRPWKRTRATDWVKFQTSWQNTKHFLGKLQQNNPKREQKTTIHLKGQGHTERFIQNQQWLFE